MSSEPITAAQRRLNRAPVPEGWKVVHLGDVFDPIIDTGHKIDLPVLSVTIGGRVVRRSSLDRKSDREVPREKYLRVLPGDIAYNTMRMWQGASGLVTEEGYISPAYTVCRPRPGESPEFWAACFQSSAMIRAFRDHSQGFAKDRYRLYYHHFATVSALRPPVSEQRRIAAILFSVNQGIEGAKNTMDELKRLKATLAHDLFAALTNHWCRPDSWDRAAFEDLVDVVAPPAKAQKSRYLTEGRYPVVDQGREFVAGYSNDPALLYEGRLPVIVFGDHTRVFKFVDFPFVCGADGVKILSPREPFDPQFLYYLFESRPLGDLGYSRHFKLLKELVFDIPPFYVQQKVATILACIDQVISRVAALGEAETVLKTALYRFLLSG